MARTLAELLVAKSQDQIEDLLLATLAGAGFPVTDYFTGAVGRTVQKMVARGLVDFAEMLPQITAGGFLGPFTINGETLPSSDWLELLASEVYGLTRAPATYTKQRIALWNAVGTGPYVIGSVGQLTARSREGRRYTSLTTGTVVAGTEPPTKLYLEFVAEASGALYNGDGAGTIVELTTPLPGLQITNEPLAFGGIDTLGRAARSGSSTGTITPTGTPTGSHRYKLTIASSGQTGVALGSLSVDGATPTILTLTNGLAVGDGSTLTIVNGAQDPSFIIGDVFSWETPGSPILNAGTDAESDDLLRARCRGRWPSLSDIPTESRYVQWVREASTANGYGITKITASPSITRAGFVDVRVATQAGPVPAGAVLVVQGYIDARDGITDQSLVESAIAQAISAGNTGAGSGVTVRSSEVVAVKAQAKVNWEKYIADLPIGGSKPEGVVRLSELYQAVMDAGAVDATGLTLNGGGGAAATNVVLDGSDRVATVGNDITTALTWLEVP